MSLVKLYNKMKKISSNPAFVNAIATHSNLYTADNNLKLEINGIPSSILIRYTGSCFFNTLMKSKIRIDVGKNTILIINLFKQRLPDAILSFSGEFKIISCRIMNFDGSVISANINNTGIEEIVEESPTNLEDDTIILEDDLIPPGEVPLNTGLARPILTTYNIDKLKYIEKYSIKERERFKRDIKEEFDIIKKDKIRKQPIKTTIKPKKAKPTRVKIKRERGKY